MMYLLDEPGRQKLVDLLADDPALLLVDVAQALLHRFGPSLDLQCVLSDFPRYAWHVRGTPCKHVGVCAEKVDEHCFLFVVEAGADRQRLLVGAAWVEQDFLCVLCRLETARMALGFGGLGGEALEDQGQFGGLDGLSVLDALDVTVVRVFVGGVDGNDTLGPQHLELKICVVGDRHEPRVPGSPNDSVVCAGELNHLECEGLPPEVRVGAEADGEVDAADGQSLFPRYDPVEAPSTGLKLRPLNPQEVEGLHIDDVKATAPIHEHFGETSVDDDWIDDERVGPRPNNVVGMVITVERDGRIRPVEVMGGGYPNGENLPALLLALSWRVLS